MRRNPTVLAIECLLGGVIAFLLMYFWRKTSLTTAVLEGVLITAAAAVGSYFYYKRTSNK